MTSIVEKAVARARSMGSPRPGDSGARSAEETGLHRVMRPAMIESASMERNKIISAIEDPAGSAAYKVLRTRVLQRLRSNNWRSMLVTAVDAGEGKTLTSCNLAVSVARDVNQSVFLVDLDLQRPNMARYFGLNVKAGIGDYLKGEAEIEDIIYSPAEMERIIIIPNREPIENPSELLSSPRMKQLMAWLHARTTAPYAIFDMPPVLASDDVLAFLPQVDCVLFVVAEGSTERKRLTNVLELMGEFDLVGVVLNKSKEHQKAYAYY